MHTADALPDHHEPSAGSRALSPWAGLALALVAGAICWAAIRATYPVFHVPEEYHAAMGAPAAEFAALRQQQDYVDRHHAMLYVGGLGALIGVALGIGESVARRCWLPPLITPLLGAAGGAVGGFLGCLVYEYVRANVGQAELKHAIAAQVLLATPLALGIGLGLGLATRRISGIAKFTLAGLAAGVLAGIVFPVAVSILLPAASTDALLPDLSSSRMLWLAVLSGLTGLVVPVAGRRRESKSSPDKAAS